MDAVKDISIALGAIAVVLFASMFLVDQLLDVPFQLHVDTVFGLAIVACWLLGWRTR